MMLQWKLWFEEEKEFVSKMNEEIREERESSSFMGRINVIYYLYYLGYSVDNLTSA